ncbi:MAG: hypothetical protein HY828_18725 [Actinobacteria bacterium]|nr:hypothetical protein [Actinomycetota bacterium]
MSVRIIESSLAHPQNRRGTAVSATAHLDTFPPVLMAAFGERWFEEGCLSLEFRSVTDHCDPVRAGLVVDDTGVAAASLVTPEGVVVADGTAAVGREASRSMLAAPRGDDTRDIAPALVHCPSIAQSRRIVDGLIASPIEWYHGPSPWGPSVTAPSSVIEMFSQVAEAHLTSDTAGVITAVEIRYHGEPIVCDTEYAVEGRLARVDGAPNHDVLWCDMTASDEQGYVVASARVLAEFPRAATPSPRGDRSRATVRAL